MIKIDDCWAIDFDKWNLILSERHVVTGKGKLGSRVELPEDQWTERWASVSFHGSFRDLKHAYLKRRITAADASSFDELIKVVKDVERKIDAVDPIFFRLVKKELRASEGATDSDLDEETDSDETPDVTKVVAHLLDDARKPVEAPEALEELDL